MDGTLLTHSVRSFGSVCSGIGCGDLAFERLGWRCAWQAEIEPFPAQVLAARFGASAPEVMPNPDAEDISAESRKARLAAIKAVIAAEWPVSPRVRNLGDMTSVASKVLFGEIEAPDAMIGGCPCQAFSVAGLRGGISDERGNLTLEYVRIADAIDAVRLAAGKPAGLYLYENVPGILSMPDNAFGAFLAGMVGADTALRPPSGRRWPDAGVVHGPARCAAWRILDAQHFGLAQRRRRVFVLAHGGAGAWAAADAILPVIESVQWHPAPRREAGKGSPGRAAAGAGERGEPAGLIPETATTLRARDAKGSPDSDMTSTLLAFGGNNTSGPIDVATARVAHGGPHGRLDFETETFVTQPAPVECVTGDVTHTLTTRCGGRNAGEDGTGRGTPLVPAPRIVSDDPAHAICANEQRTYTNEGSMFQLRNVVAEPVAFTAKDYGADAGDLAPTLRAMGHDGSHANGGGQLAVAFDVLGVPATTGARETDLHTALRPRAPGASEASTTTVVAQAFTSATEFLPQSSRVYSEGEAAPTLKAAGTRNGNRAPQVAAGMAVRRLLPVECEKLQGLPPAWTLIPIRRLSRKRAEAVVASGCADAVAIIDGKPWALAADGPRYKAIGNGMAVPCIAYIVARIDAVLRQQEVS